MGKRREEGVEEAGEAINFFYKKTNFIYFLPPLS
jgi:hypothetical protein